MAAITREELLILLEAVIREAPVGQLRLDSSARWQADHDEFCRRLCTRLVDALDQAGYAWARLPRHGDDLYRVLIAATNDLSGLQRTGLVSESAGTREFAREQVADRVLEFLGRTQTVVIRRKSSA